MKKEQAVLFVYPKQTNKNWVKKVANQTGQPMGHIVDVLVESVRLGKPFEIKRKLTLKEMELKAKKPKRNFKAVKSARSGVSK